MGTEVLRPQEFSVERFHVPPTSFHRRKFHGNLTNFIVNRKPYNNNNNNRKISPKPEKKKSTTESKKSNGGLEMGQVTLLRRGESLGSLTSKINGGNPNPKTSKSPKIAVPATGSNGSESPERVLKQIRLVAPPSSTMYAGSAFSLSPSPRSVPLPSFFNSFNKKQDEEEIPMEDSATQGLRRLLRLD